MAKTINVPAVGSITGSRHVRTSFVLTDGRSLHPLQRTGYVAHSGHPAQGAPSLPGVTSTPYAAAPHDMTYPNILNNGIIRATTNRHNVG